MIKEEVRNKRALKKRHETRGEEEEKRKQAGGEMKRDKR